MKKFTLLLILLHCFLKTSAQNTFEKVIDTLGCARASSIQQTFDGGYVFAGQSNNGGNDAIIVKLDSTGIIEWAKVYSGPGIESGVYIEQTVDSGYIVNALYDGGLQSKSWLLRLDMNGDTLWTKVLTAGNGATEVLSGSSLAVLNNSIYGLTGNFNPNSGNIVYPYFIGILTNGLQIASKLYNFSSILSSEARSIAKTNDFGFIMAGAIGIPGSGGDVYIIRTNAYGDTIWTRTYNNSSQDAAFSIQQTIDSGFIVAGFTYYPSILKDNIYIIKTNDQGDTLWTKNFGGNTSCLAYCISQTIDGGFIISGRIVNGSPLDVDVFLLKTDSIGDLQWTKQFGGSMPDDGYFVRQTMDGGYIIAGSGTYPGASSSGAYIIKTDSNGQVLTGIESPELNNPIHFEVFPNPSSGNFSIRITGFPSKYIELGIYNIMNECVYTCNLMNNTIEQLNLENLADGVYAIKVLVNQKIYSRKMLVLH